MPLDTSCTVSARRRPPGANQAPNKTSKYLRLPPVEKMSRFSACIFQLLRGALIPRARISPPRFSTCWHVKDPRDECLTSTSAEYQRHLLQDPCSLFVARGVPPQPNRNV